MKKTLLEIVQDIGFLVESGEISSINETYESEQIARIVKLTYESMIVSNQWPHLERLIKILASGDNTLPTHMTMQDSVSHVREVAYNVGPRTNGGDNYVTMKYVDPDVFLRRSSLEDSTSSKVVTVADPSGATLYIRNDRDPSYYTSFDDKVLIFDAYDSAIENTLQESKVRVRAKVLPTFLLDDTYIPDLPEEAFPLLLEESLSRASVVIRQVVDTKAEQMAGKQSRWLSRNRGRATEHKVKYPNYGRK